MDARRQRVANAAAAFGTRTKQRRVTQACDFCHQRSIRCRPASDGGHCQNCRDFAHECTYLRTPRRRGVQPREPSLAAKQRDATSQHGPAPASGVQQHPTTPINVAVKTTAAVVAAGCRGSQSNSHDSHRSDDAWSAPVVASQAVIMDLVELYFEIVYPIFPFFHQPSFARRISRADYMNGRALFALTMAMCSLVSCRVRDGAVSNPEWDLASILTISPDVFYAHAKAQLRHSEVDTGIDTLRAHAILAIFSIQNGKSKDMHLHLGTYHTLVAIDALHDEANWPKNIGNIEREERRRLFWSIYTLDIYVSVVWGGIIRCREKQSKVAYPTELDDELISDSRTAQAPVDQRDVSPSSRRHTSRVSSESWISGWNFVTDLYRVLEHALTRFRGYSNRTGEYSFLQDIFDDGRSSITEASVCESVLQMYINLPDCFKNTPDMTFQRKKDRFGFQAANITATLQLVRMVLFAAGGASIEARCQIASEVVDAFVAIPATYLLAISTPLLHHLGGIGAILGALEESVSETKYRKVQALMLSMAQLLENLEPMHQSSSASQNLRLKAERINELIESRRNSTMREPTLVAESQMPPGSFGENAYDLHEVSCIQEPSAASEPLSVLSPLDFLDQLAWNFDFSQS